MDSSQNVHHRSHKRSDQKPTSSRTSSYSYSHSNSYSSYTSSYNTQSFYNTSSQQSINNNPIEKKEQVENVNPSINIQQQAPTRRRAAMPTSSSQPVPSHHVSVKQEETKDVISETYSENEVKRDAKGKVVKKTGSYNLFWVEIIIAVAIWYLLGVLSISTTKMLLSEYDFIGITPLSLTAIQIFLGFIFLRIWILTQKSRSPHPIKFGLFFQRSSKTNANGGYHYLSLASIFFLLGFWFTNLSFSGADASFVETIKASEPISSAFLAVWWGIETISIKEVISLLGICVGAVMSTLGNGKESELSDDIMEDVGNNSILMQSIISSGIVLCANLCFSFRGLYQKLLRATPNGSKSVVNDLNLQYRVHQIGFMVILIPVLVLDLPTLLEIWHPKRAVGALDELELDRFLILLLANSFAFTHYNLASSFILTRLSVVYHAVLNCIRRLFAIVVTSIVFSVSIKSWHGILVSISGFLFYTKFKMSRTKSHLPRKDATILPS